MNTIEILVTLFFITVLIVQYLHFSYKLKKERTFSEQTTNSIIAQNDTINRLGEQKKELEDLVKYNVERILTKENQILEWKDSSNQKQILLDNLNIKLEAFILLLNKLKVDWNKHLSIIEDSETVTWPALRLSIKDETRGYSVVTYQGSRDVSNKTDFFFQVEDNICLDLSSIISEIDNTYNPVESEKVQTIINYLKK